MKMLYAVRAAVLLSVAMIVLSCSGQPQAEKSPPPARTVAPAVHAPEAHQTPHSLPFAGKVEAQPLAAQVRRVADAMAVAGIPLSAAESAALTAAIAETDPDICVTKIQNVFDPHCLVAVDINPESRVKARPGLAAPVLVERGWQTFLIKVANSAGVTAALNVSSPNAGQLANSPAGEIRDKWLDVSSITTPPLQAALGGLGLEYRLFSIYAREAGTFEGKLVFDVGQGTQDLGFRSEANILFKVEPGIPLVLNVKDTNGAPTTFRVTIKDSQGRVYPSRNKRLGGDFFFQDQIYRSTGDQVGLAPGFYTVEVGRGPEYLIETREVNVTAPGPCLIDMQLRRWVHPAAKGWYSGDHHIHAAGCQHFTKPTEGVLPEDMMRHVLGEDLNVGSVLTWGPGFEYQKRFFSGKTDEVSKGDHIVRYDVEVSGFGSHQSGHYCLLRLKDMHYPGSGEDKTKWPTWCLPMLRWAKAQGAVVGPAHSGSGLYTENDGSLPNYTVPSMNGIGAMEFFADITYGVVDFISTVDTGCNTELNAWYHVQNCGYRIKISGETDFPCITGDRVGIGRAYVRLKKALGETLSYDDWVEGIRQGAAYVSEGKSHLMDFRVNDRHVGEGDGEVHLDLPGTVAVRLTAAALLPEEPVTEKWPWSLEKARQPGGGRQVPVEIVVNGFPVGRQIITADGSEVVIEQEIPIERSSWVAARILGASHTNSVYVIVGGQPIRASQKSAFWCHQVVEQTWREKHRFIAKAERPEARKAYDGALESYKTIFEESVKEEIQGWPVPFYPFGFEAFPGELAKIKDTVESKNLAEARSQAESLSNRMGDEIKAGRLTPGSAKALEERLDVIRLAILGDIAQPVPAWEVAGPFPAEGRRSLNIVYPPETEGPESKGPYPGRDGMVKWQRVASSEGLVTLSGAGPNAGVYPNLGRGTVYLRAVIESPDERRVRLDLRFSAVAKIWLNGDLAFECQDVRNLSLEPERVGITLKKGRNNLLAKVTTGGAPLGLSLTPVSTGGLTFPE